MTLSLEYTLIDQVATTGLDAHYRNLSATDIARLVNQRSISAVEITRTALRYAARADHALRAFRDLWLDRAIQTARRIDHAIAAGDHLPLAGVPLAVKASEGVTSIQAQRLICAGCVPIGAASVPGPGTPWRTWGSTDRGPTLNPWRADRSPGGSSAGSAVAVATRAVPLATASDGAGSVRIPAAWCGVLGLKPTTGRLPARDRAGLTVAGPIARNLADIATYLTVVYGIDESASTRTDKPLRTVWSTDLGYADVDPQIAVLARTTASAMERAGIIELTEHPIRLQDPQPSWSALRAPGGDQLKANRILVYNDERLREVFDVADLIATPTTPYPAHGHDGPGSAMNVALTWAFNLSGHPAITIPAGISAEGTPVGLQLVARHHAESDLLQVGGGTRHVDTATTTPKPVT